MNFSRTKRPFLIKIWFVISFYNIQKIKKSAFYICKEYICQPCTANNVENSKGSENQKQKCSFAGIWGKKIPFHHFSSALSWFAVKDFQYFFRRWLSHSIFFICLSTYQFWCCFLLSVFCVTSCEESAKQFCSNTKCLAGHTNSFLVLVSFIYKMKLFSTIILINEESAKQSCSTTKC